MAPGRGSLPASTVIRSCRKPSPSRLPVRPLVSQASLTLPFTTGLAFRPTVAAADATPGRRSTCRMTGRTGPGTLTNTSLELIARR